MFCYTCNNCKECQNSYFKQEILPFTYSWSISWKTMKLKLHKGSSIWRRDKIILENMLLLLFLLPPANEVWGKVMFSQVCVNHSVHGGGSLSRGHPRPSQTEIHIDTDPLTETSGQRPPGQRPPWTETLLDRDPLDRDPLYGKERMVRILLERILVVVVVVMLSIVLYHTDTTTRAGCLR